MKLGVISAGGCCLALFLAFCPAVRSQDQQLPAPPPPPRRGGPALSPQERAAQEEKANSAWNALSLEEKMRVMRVHRGLRALPPEERKQINDRIDHFLNMSQQERQQLQQNLQRWQNMTPEERQRARDEFRKRRKAFEEKWRQDHPGQEPPPFLNQYGGPTNAPSSSPPRN